MRAVDGPLWQVSTLQVAVYEVLVVGLTVIEAPVAPFDQVTVPAQPVAVSVALPPKQMVSELHVTTGGVTVITVMVFAADGALTQSPTLHVAVYEVVAVGLTVIEAPVAPVDHVTVPAQPAAVKVALPPEQIVSFEQLITGGSGLLTVIVLLPGVLTHSPTLQVAV